MSNAQTDPDRLAASNQRIEALPTLRSLVNAMEFQAQKSLGQNFLFDLNLTRRIARAALPLDGTTIEIGPGPGGLTRALLLEGATRLIAVEKDRRATDILESLVTAADGRLQLIEEDALRCPVWEMGASPRQIVANLPYNIATSLLIEWLSHAGSFSCMTLMFQREVAQRITASPGDSHFGRLSVLANWKADTQILFDVPPEAFVPAPKVTSSVIQIIPLPKPRFPCEQSFLEEVTRLAFGQRRKMLRASLKPIGGEALLASADVNPQARPQDLTIAEFCALARCLAANKDT